MLDKALTKTCNRDKIKIEIIFGVNETRKRTIEKFEINKVSVARINFKSEPVNWCYCAALVRCNHYCECGKRGVS